MDPGRTILKGSDGRKIMLLRKVPVGSKTPGSLLKKKRTEKRGLGGILLLLFEKVEVIGQSLPREAVIAAILLHLAFFSN